MDSRRFKAIENDCYGERLAMAKGRVRLRYNGNYYIDYWVHGKRYRETIGTKKREAELVLAERLAAAVRGDHPELYGQKRKQITFRDYGERYLETHPKLSERSRKRYLSYLRSLTNTFGNKWLHEISHEDVIEYQINRKGQPIVTKKGRKKAQTGVTVNRHLSLLRAVFNKAIRDRYARENPVSGVQFFPERQRLDYLNQSQIERLCKACSDKFRPIVRLIVNTGMRPTEVRNLKWKDICFDRGVILLRNTKNGEDRYVYLNETAKRAIVTVPKKGEHVFCKNNRGEPYSEESPFRREWHNAWKRSGLGEDKPNFRLYDLRHTFASHAYLRSKNLYATKELLGHKTLAMTLRYAHISEDQLMQTVRLLDQDHHVTVAKPSQKDVFRNPITQKSS